MTIMIPLPILIGVLIAMSAIIGFELYYFIEEGFFLLPIICFILIVVLIVIGAYLCR